MPNDKFLADRQTGIGGSDAAAILGVSPYTSALEVYAQKIGEADPKEQSDAMEWGHRLEAAVCQKFFDDHPDFEPITFRSDEMVRHPEFPFWISHPDRIIRSKTDGRTGVLEAKTVNAYVKQKITETTPTEFRVQLQHNIEACRPDFGTTFGFLAILIGGQAYVDIGEDIHTELVVGMGVEYSRFWKDHVEAKVPPKAQGLAQESKVLDRLYGIEDAKVIELPPDLVELDDEFRDLKASAKTNEARQEEIRVLIQDHMKDAAAAIIPGTKRVWRRTTVNRKAYEVKAGSYQKIQAYGK